MKTIPLTQGQVALVDDADYEWLSAFKWYAHKRDNGDFYAIQRIRNPPDKEVQIRMHRMILYGVPEVDHWNHNTLDNQRGNLRAATKSQNQANSRRHEDNRSGFKGVTWRKDAGKWVARIIASRRQIHLGFFTGIADAARAYDKAARENFGEFACLNLPEKATDEPNRPAKAAPDKTL